MNPLQLLAKAKFISQSIWLIIDFSRFQYFNTITYQNWLMDAFFFFVRSQNMWPSSCNGQFFSRYNVLLGANKTTLPRFSPYTIVHIATIALRDWDFDLRAQTHTAPKFHTWCLTKLSFIPMFKQVSKAQASLKRLCSRRYT